MPRWLAALIGAATLVVLLPVRVGVVTGDSMDPTLRSGQLVAVDRAWSRGRGVAAGDVVLFRGAEGVYVKRVYATAGQTVSLLEEGEGENVLRLPVAPGAERRIAARLAGRGDVRLRQVTVPAGMFFALGDAVHNSEDSRDFGPVPVERILGRVLPLGASLAAPDIELRDLPPFRLAGRGAATPAL